MTRNGQRLLLLIDDEPAQQRLIAALAQRGGWRTLFATDADMAASVLGSAQGRELDAVLIEHWAGADATALIADCHALRPELPILMLTANDSVAQAVAAMRAGATDFLVKPLAPNGCSPRWRPVSRARPAASFAPDREDSRPPGL